MLAAAHAGQISSWDGRIEKLCDHVTSPGHLQELQTSSEDGSFLMPLPTGHITFSIMS